MTFRSGFRHALILGVCIPGLALALASSSHAQGIAVVVDGSSVDFSSSPPFMQNGSVLVPLRGVFERLGAGVNYNASTRTIEATRGQTDVVLRLGENTAYINQQAQPLLQPPVVVNGSTFVPLRFVAQSFGAQVNWIAASQTVDIRTAGGGPPTYAVGDQDVDDGPVRLARFDDIEGNVTWRPTSDTDWSPAAPNIPLREGAQIWEGDGGRAEIQFDDGSWLRLANNAIATIQTLHSNEDGEFTEIELSQGVAFVHLRNPDSMYQIDTAIVSVKAVGHAKIRVDAINGVAIAVHEGNAEVTGSSGDERLQSGSFLRLADANDQYNVGPLPGPDGWDRWNDARDAWYGHPDPNLPPSIALVAGDLDRFGQWNQDPRYGAVWTPREPDPDWRPYEHGHWVWVVPFGWTWVAGEPWGWAPYHYGTWVREPFGWSWVPGPRQQYWSPGVVYFSEYHGNVCWAPLAPTEVQYPPTIAVSLHGHDWSLNFSIGGCAVYTPQGNHSCAPRPWVNHQVNAHNSTTVINNIYNNHTTVVNVTNTVTKYVFVPQNGANGATSTSTSTFGRSGSYQPVHDLAAAAFVRGRPAAAPAPNGAASSGPADIPPSRESLTPARAFAPAPPSVAAAISQPLFHAPRQPSPATPPPPARTWTPPPPAPAPATPPPPARTWTPPPPAPAPTPVNRPRPARPAPAPAPVQSTRPAPQPAPRPVGPPPNPGQPGAPGNMPNPARPQWPAPNTTGRVGPPPPATANSMPSIRITGMSPTSGKENSMVTITGMNITSTRALSFNGVGCPFTVRNGTTITVIVPRGARSGPVSITGPNGQTVGAGNFVVER
ncbi:MAG: stalk domain-containing protein [Capsulimonadaceae bacterium]